MNNGCFDVICNTVEYRKYNSAANKKQLQDFKVYPNPANNKVFISLNNIASTVKISVTDLSGKVLHAFEKNNVEQGIQVFEWNAENVSNGLYIVHVQSGNASAYKRLSIMH
jgi:flagellar hook assembly protein FlgD